MPFEEFRLTWESLQLHCACSEINSHHILMVWSQEAHPDLTREPHLRSASAQSHAVPAAREALHQHTAEGLQRNHSLPAFTAWEQSVSQPLCLQHGYYCIKSPAQPFFVLFCFVFFVNHFQQESFMLVSSLGKNMNSLFWAIAAKMHRSTKNTWGGGGASSVKGILQPFVGSCRAWSAMPQHVCRWDWPCHRVWRRPPGLQDCYNGSTAFWRNQPLPTFTQQPT